MRIPNWLSTGFRRVRSVLTPSEIAWRGAVVALRILVGLIVLAVLSTYVLPHFSSGKLIGFLVVMVSLALAGILLRLVEPCGGTGSPVGEVGGVQFRRERHETLVERSLDVRGS